MRKYLLILTFLVIAGCDEKLLKIEESGLNTVQLTIYRSIAIHPDPSLLILAKEVSFNYDERIITVKGLINIVGDGSLSVPNEWVVPEIKVQDNTLIINIPKDNPYSVYIGEQYHYLSVVK